MNRKSLLIKAGIRFILSIGILSCLLFISSGSFSFLNAWIYIGIISAAMVLIFSYLIINDPELLVKRIKNRERVEKQKFIQRAGILPFSAANIIPGLDYRYGWSDVHESVIIAGIIFVLLGYIMFFFVLRENSYASRVIEIQDDQKVINSGMYSLIRHPMYLAVLFIFMFSPLVLGSYYALIPVLLYPYIFVVRILNEEEILKNDLKGYNEYMKKVKYRLIPFIW